MEDKQSVDTTINTSQTEPSLIDSEKKQTPWIVIGLAIMMVFSLGTIGYFGYQNYRMKQQIRQKQSTPLPVVTKQPEAANPTPTIDPIAEWKTYSASTYEVKYPEEMTARIEEASVFYLSKWGPTQKKDTELYDGISLRFQPFELPDIDLEAYVQDKVQETETEGMAEIISPPVPINIGDYKGLTYTSRGLGTHKYIYIQSSDKIMLMEIIDSTVDPNNQGFQQITDQILSTFKFIK